VAFSNGRFITVGDEGTVLISGAIPPLAPDDPLPITVERQGAYVKVHYFEGYYKLQGASTLQGPWTHINSASPYVEKLSDSPLRFFRVAR
jgi:hypothetical protein